MRSLLKQLYVRRYLALWRIAVAVSLTEPRRVPKVERRRRHRIVIAAFSDVARKV